eukprot:g232.t1
MHLGTNKPGTKLTRPVAMWKRVLAGIAGAGFLIIALGAFGNGEGWLALIPLVIGLGGLGYAAEKHYGGLKMANPYNTPHPSGGGNSGPPGQELLGIALAGVAAVIGTPYLFSLIGPAIADIVSDAYDSEGFASLMYFASYGLSGVVIFCVCRMALFYAIGAIVAFATLRFGGGLPMAAF